MAKTLRGAPIVGCYKKDYEDFRDHGELITIDGDSITFSCQTQPYGFISPDSKVWFQDFSEINEDGTESIRKYLMATGYLWTGQYPECKIVTEEGRPQSMELDEKTLEGAWTKLANEDMEFFIVNDAIFSKLCILGQDIEPCFEGGMITKQNTQFSKSNNFGATLYTMMNELKNVLAHKGGQFNMENEKNENLNNKENSTPVENTFKKKPEEDKTSLDNKDKASTEDEKKEDKKPENAKEEKNDKKKEDYVLLSTQYSALKEELESLKSINKELLSFKKQTEDAKKDEMIKSFYMLSDEDKKDVIENKDKYSLEEIESKLSVICVRKKVNFNLNDSTENDNKVGDSGKDSITTYNLNDATDSAPEWIKALRQTKVD